MLPVVLLLHVSLTPVARSQAYDEYELKAAFFFKFARFVEWPPASEKEEEAPKTFDIGVLGEDPFGKRLDDIVAGQKLLERPVRIVRSDTVDDLLECAMVFVAASKADAMDELLPVLAQRSILTVSDLAGFIEQGGMIYLERAGSRIQFWVNYDAAQEAGLKISAQLLKLAKEVRHSTEDRQHRDPLRPAIEGGEE